MARRVRFWFAWYVPLVVLWLAFVDTFDAAPVRREIVAVRRRDAGPPSGAAGLFLEMLAGSARD